LSASLFTRRKRLSVGVPVVALLSVVLKGLLAALRRELRPALGATALQNETAGFRRHPRSKSMRASPLDFAGLKCSFHLGAT